MRVKKLFEDFCVLIVDVLYIILLEKTLLIHNFNTF